MDSISSSSSSATWAKWEKSKRSRVGIDRRAGLLHVRAQHLAQRGVKQVRAGVVAADGVAALGVDYGADVIAHCQVLLEQGLVGANALHGKHAALNFGDGRVAVGGGEPAGVAGLPAGVAVEAGLVEHHLDLVASRGGGNARAVLHDGQDFGAGGDELLVAQEVGLGQFAEGRAGRLLAAALPTGAGAGLLFFPWRPQTLRRQRSTLASRAASTMKSSGRPKVS